MVRQLLVLILALASGVPAQESSAADGGWAGVWDELDRFRAEGGDPGRVRLLAEADDVPRDALRSTLLAAALDGVLEPALRAGIDAVAGGSPWPLDGRESWLAASLLAPGATRGRAVVAALARTPEALDGARIRLAYDAGVEAAEDLRMGEALAIQQDLHARAKAEWSAFNLALSLRRVGDYDGADEVLAAQMALGGGSPDLASQRGLNALGGGREAEALEHLAVALARGSDDAAVILARLDLARGRMRDARAGFRALIARPEPGAWAIRGWGVSLVETPLGPSDRQSAASDRR